MQEKINIPGDQGLPRVPLRGDASPLVKLSKLGEELGHPNLYMKRDDLGFIGGGGNKLRKLEYILGKATEDQCDTLITFGALQSNHARLTAAAAARLGLECHLVLAKRVPRKDEHYESSGNVLLDRLLGARLHILDEAEDSLAHGQALAAEFRQAGRRPYIVPFGGSDALGAIGYASVVDEIVDQLGREQVGQVHVFHASGSGGTQAGLMLGAHRASRPVQVRGISVLSRRDVLADKVSELVQEGARMLSLDAPLPMPIIDDQFIGSGYGIPNADVVDTLSLVARTEGVFLDPVYTGKAFSGLIAALRSGAVPREESVVFVHTGGMPGLFAYAGMMDEFGR